jgi:glycerol-3-phosphate dehydrogenase
VPFFPVSAEDERERLMPAEEETARVGRQGEAGEGLFAAQVRWAAEDEWALALDDLLLRRVAPGALDLVGCREKAARAAGLLGARLGWTDEEREGQVTQFVTAIDRELSAALRAERC